MSDLPKKLLMLTSGGDAPGMNATIRAVTRTALYYGITVYGAENGYYGLLDGDIVSLDASSVGNCIQRGGTILKTGRCPRFHQASERKKAIQFLQSQNISHLIVLGGDGSFRGATFLAQESGIHVIGIPCTIDNDINGTEYCIGFDTACNTALEAIDKIRDTAYSHNRNFIVEVMGRSSGFIAVEVGIAGGAEIVLTPEFPIATSDLIKKLQSNRRQKATSIIVAAEASQPGRSFDLAKEIETQSGIAYKVCVLGHTQRGGTPSVYDRKIAAIMGAHAVTAIIAGETLKMTAIQNNKLTLTDFPEPKHATRHFADAELLQMNEIICDI